MRRRKRYSNSGQTTACSTTCSAPSRSRAYRRQQPGSRTAVGFDMVWGPGEQQRRSSNMLRKSVSRGERYDAVSSLVALCRSRSSGTGHLRLELCTHCQAFNGCLSAGLIGDFGTARSGHRMSDQGRVLPAMFPIDLPASSRKEPRYSSRATAQITARCAG